MDSNLFYPNLWRFLGLLAAQLVLFQPISAQLGVYFNIMLWPLFVLLLPLETSTPVLILLGCLMGFTLDAFSGAYGIQASAGAFAGFVRPLILGFFEPKGGFSGKELLASPHHLGWNTFARVAGTFFFLYFFWLYSVDAFTFVYFEAITLKTLSSWALTMFFLGIYAFLFNPKI